MYVYVLIQSGSTTPVVVASDPDAVVRDRIGLPTDAERVLDYAALRIFPSRFDVVAVWWSPGDVGHYRLLKCGVVTPILMKEPD